jgi:hypothetical protein
MIRDIRKIGKSTITWTASDELVEVEIGAMKIEASL